MRIGLVDIDSKIANVALMKISSYHKSIGDNVEWWKGPLFHHLYDKVYASKVFDFSRIPFDLPSDVDMGGSGYNISKQLPNKIDSCSPDYSIYPDCDYSIQRFHVGCIRRCKFCIVHRKEGHIKAVDPMALNPIGKFIRLIDNNFFANPKWKNAIDWLVSNDQPVWVEGVDARTLTKENADSLNLLKLYKQIHMAWDNVNDFINWELICKWIKPYKIMVYVLIGYNSSKEEDMYRIETLRSHKIDPFVMPYNKSDKYQKRFARWVNHKAVFKTVKWEDYK